MKIISKNYLFQILIENIFENSVYSEKKIHENLPIGSISNLKPFFFVERRIILRLYSRKHTFQKWKQNIINQSEKKIFRNCVKANLLWFIHAFFTYCCYCLFLFCCVTKLLQSLPSLVCRQRKKKSLLCFKRLIIIENASRRHPWCMKISYQHNLIKFYNLHIF